VIAAARAGGKLAIPPRHALGQPGMALPARDRHGAARKGNVCTIHFELRRCGNAFPCEAKHTGRQEIDHRQQNSCRHLRQQGPEASGSSVIVVVTATLPARTASRASNSENVSPFAPRRWK
jgi:hypothetical protein